MNVCPSGHYYSEIKSKLVKYTFHDEEVRAGVTASLGSRTVNGIIWESWGKILRYNRDDLLLLRNMDNAGWAVTTGGNLQ